jgi:hypothetical protein
VDSRINVLSNPILPKSERTELRHLNTSVFAPPTRAEFGIGNAPKDVFRLPGTNVFDVSFYKNIPFGNEDRYRLQLRFEFYNFFNHASFQGVDTTARFDAAGPAGERDLRAVHLDAGCAANRSGRVGAKFYFYSRDGRPDCKQVIVALVITPEGFPLAYEVMDGNTSDKTTLRGFLAKIEEIYGQARRVWLMDRGIPTEAVLQEMRQTERPMFYLVGTPRARVTQYEKQWLDLPWHKVRDSVEVKLFGQDGELYVLAKSEGRQQKEIAIRRKKLARFLRKLRRMRKSLPSRDQLLLRIGAAKKEAGRAFGFVKIRVPGKNKEVTRETFTFQTDRKRLQEAERRDGHYLLRTNLVAEDPTVLWDRYMQLTQIEAAFKCLKSELGIRPIYHQLEHRVEAHILVAFLAYCLSVTLKHRLQAHAPGLTPRAVLEKLASIQMLDVSFPTADGRCLTMPRYTEPAGDIALLLHHLQLTLPNQPPPRIAALSGEPLPSLKM